MQHTRRIERLLQLRDLIAIDPNSCQGAVPLVNLLLRDFFSMAWQNLPSSLHPALLLPSWPPPRLRICQMPLAYHDQSSPIMSMQIR